MTFSTHYKALLRKNMVTSKNSCCGTCCEILTPIMMAVLVLYINESGDGVEWIKEQKQISESRTWTLGSTNYLPFGEIWLEALQRYEKRS